MSLENSYNSIPPPDGLPRRHLRDGYLHFIFLFCSLKKKLFIFSFSACICTQTHTHTFNKSHSNIKIHKFLQ